MPKYLNLLIIDDDEVDRMTMIRSLKTSGIKAHIETADTGAEGLEKIRSGSFDCIFLDFRLPDSDGLQLLREFQKLKINTPVLLITSFGDERVAAEAIKQGAQDYISKSLVTPEGISHSLRTALRLYRNEIEQKAIAEALQKTQQQLDGVINVAPIVLWSVDTEGIFTLARGKGLELLGLKTEAIIGRPATEVFTNFPELLANLKKAFRGEIKRVTNQINNTYFDTRYQLLQDEAGRITGLTAISFDVTERVNFEKALKKAKELAEQSARVKEQFLTNISHEIRTPMNGIIGLTNVLAKMVKDKEQQSYLQAIQTSTDRLMNIINDLLDFSKIEAGKIELEETAFNLRDLLTELNSLLGLKAKERNNRLKIIMDQDIPETVVGDPGRLNQILTNLVGNAIKFTEAGTIRILADTTQEDDETIEILFEVQDTGIGIAEDKLHTIFDSFTQASSETTRKFGGTGLGLTISRQLVEILGGTLQVKSKLHEGSTFSFKLRFRKQPEPVRQAPPETRYENAVNPADLAPLRILMAEDNEINQLLARKIITDWGFEIEIVDNGKKAIEKLQQNDYDLVLMDMQMPEMDGYDAMIHIRNYLGPKSNIPIIAFTAHASKGEIGKCLMAGANAYVSKPLKPDELLLEIADLMEESAELRFSPASDPVIANAGPAEELQIDLSFLKEVAAGNQEFMNEIISLFIKQVPESLERMQESLTHQDWTNLKAIAHRLKSSMFLLGIKELEMAMMSIEQGTADEEGRKKLQPLLSRISEIVTVAIGKLKNVNVAVL